ncbi:MAG TPA: hypoxanthine phosphoribosyltransferase [bacterium]|nr:hypoxanthine phosphoribosyltransferase [bacterium]
MTSQANLRAQSNGSDRSLRLILTEKEIQKTVRKLGKRISKDYEGKELFCVGVLKGALMFMTDLVRNISIPVAYDLMAVSSYGAATKSSGVVRIIKDLDIPIESKHVLVIEDIIDSGLTLNYLITNLRTRNIASLKVCTLLDRPYRREVDVPVDYNGFVISDDFVVGYGLDFDQKHRNLKDIFALE